MATYTKKRVSKLNDAKLYLYRAKTAARLAEEVNSLNANCLTIGKGKLLFMKDLAEDFSLFDKEMKLRAIEGL